VKGSNFIALHKLFDVLSDNYISPSTTIGFPHS
jgi:hypothetical protein